MSWILEIVVEWKIGHCARRATMWVEGAVALVAVASTYALSAKA